MTYVYERGKIKFTTKKSFFRYLSGAFWLDAHDSVFLKIILDLTMDN